MAVTIDPLWNMPHLNEGTPDHPMSMVVYSPGLKQKSSAYNNAADVGPGHKVKWDGTTKKNGIVKAGAKATQCPLMIENKKMYTANPTRIEYALTLGAADIAPLVAVGEYCDVILEQHSMVGWGVFNTNTNYAIDVAHTDAPCGIFVTDANGEMVAIATKSTAHVCNNAWRLLMYRAACNAATNLMLTRYEGIVAEHGTAG